MRPDPYNGTDEAPTDLTPDTLFVPMFAPDEPDRYNTNEDRDYANKYLGDYIRVGPDYPAATTNYGSNSKQLLRQSWARKYNLDARLKDGSNKIIVGKQRSRDFGPYGPNQGCTTTPVTPLSGTALRHPDRNHADEPGRLHQYPGGPCMGLAAAFGRTALHGRQKLLGCGKRQVHHPADGRKQHLSFAIDAERDRVLSMGLWPGTTGSMAGW